MNQQPADDRITQAAWAQRVETLNKLREDFPRNVIGKLPKGGVNLDFVGHAAVTDRLLSVDTEWTWEPVVVDERGAPALDREGNLWIRLTVCGVTRYGVGDGASMKVRVGDAIRNAAMRFGVALSLWTRDELESSVHDEKPAAPAPTPTPPPAPWGQHVPTVRPSTTTTSAKSLAQKEDAHEPKSWTAEEIAKAREAAKQKRGR
jgi:hypothetical protein